MYLERGGAVLVLVFGVVRARDGGMSEDRNLDVSDLSVKEKDGVSELGKVKER